MQIRNAGIDLVRVVGVLAIVAGHVWLTEPVHRLLFAWHVPVFFFISGYLWKPRPMGEELVARSRTLLKPYAFWFAAIYVAFAMTIFVQSRVDAGTMLRPVYGGLYANRPFTTFWFVFSLFAAALLWQFVSRYGSWAQGLAVSLALGATVFAGPVLASTPLAIGSALPALVFVAAGTWARRIEASIRGAVWLAGIVLAVAFTLVLTGVSSPLNIKAGEWGTPILSVLVAAAISFAMLILAKAVCARASTQVAASITGFALCGFTIVLAHPAVLWALAPSGAPLVVTFVIAVAVPTTIALGALRTRLSQWVTGIPRR